MRPATELSKVINKWAGRPVAATGVVAAFWFDQRAQSRKVATLAWHTRFFGRWFRPLPRRAGASIKRGSPAADLLQI